MLLNKSEWWWLVGWGGDGDGDGGWGVGGGGGGGGGLWGKTLGTSHSSHECSITFVIFVKILIT